MSVHVSGKYTAKVSGEPAEVLTVVDAKQFMQIEPGFTDDDTLIADCIDAARAAIESRLRRFLTDTDVSITFRDQPPAYIFLPLGTCQSVTNITYRDSDHQTQVLSNSVYYADLVDKMGGRIGLTDSASWPTISTRPYSFTVNGVFGYGNAEAVPSPVRVALKRLVNELYTRRGVMSVGNLLEDKVYGQLLGREVVPVMR